MRNQSGISTIAFYNPLDTTFTRVSGSEITNLSGTNIVIANESRPDFEQAISKINRILFFDYTFSFFGFGLGYDTSQFKNKFGWLVLLTFYNADVYFLPTPVFMQETEFDTNATNVRKIEFKPDRPTGRLLKLI